jgi:putative flippase GtrA
MLNGKTLRQLAVFGMVGASATATHYLTAVSTHEVLGFNLYVANLAGYVCAIAVSYFGHGLLTFRVKLSRKVLHRFILVSVATFCTSELVLMGLERGLRLPHRISLAIAVLVILVMSFLLNKLWVYRQN